MKLNIYHNFKFTNHEDEKKLVVTWSSPSALPSSFVVFRIYSYLIQWHEACLEEFKKVDSMRGMKKTRNSLQWRGECDNYMIDCEDYSKFNI